MVAVSAVMSVTFTSRTGDGLSASMTTFNGVHEPKEQESVMATVTCAETLGKCFSADNNSHALKQWANAQAEATSIGLNSGKMIL